MNATGNGMRAAEFGLWAGWAVLITIASAGPVSFQAPLWIDELYSLATAELPPRTMLRSLFNVREGWYDQPPFYFLILRGMLPFGDAPWVLRIPSMMFSCATLALFGIMLRRRAVPWFVTAAFMTALAWHPEYRFQATSVRMYSLVLLETGAAFWLGETLLRSEGRPRRDLTVALTLVLTALLYTSYFGAYFIAGLSTAGLVAYFRPKSAARKGGGAILVASAIAIVLWLPWLPAALRVSTLTRRDAWVTPGERLTEVFHLMVTLAGSPAILPLFAAGWIGLTFAPRPERSFWWLAATFLFAIPAVLLLAMLPPSKDLQPRYLLFAAPILATASLVGWLGLLRRLRLPPRFADRLAAIIFVVCGILGATHARKTFLRPMPDWWGAAAIIEQNALPQETILTGGFLSGESLVYHLADPARFSFRHYVTRLAEFEEWCADPGTVWYVNAAPLPDSYAAIVRQNFPHGVTFDGNRGLGRIMIYSKKPFDFPQGETIGTITRASPADQ